MTLYQILLIKPRNIIILLFKSDWYFILLSMLKGLKNTTRSGDLLDQLITVFQNISTINKYDIILSVICIITLIFLKQLRSINWTSPPTSILQTVCRKIVWLTGTSSNGIVVLSSAGIAASLLAKNIDVFSMTKGVAAGLPPFRPPHLSATNTTSWDVLNNIGTGLIMIPLIGIVELMAIGKVLARKNDYTIDCSQELIAIGVANVLGSFVSAYPVTGSFSRSVVQSNSGAKTTSAGIFTGTVVIICLASLMDFVRFIPNPALASVIFCAVLPMFDPSALVKYWKLSKLDGFIWFLTFTLSIPLGIEVGLAVGMGFSLCFFVLYPSARPRIIYEFQDNCTIMKIYEKLTFAGSDYLIEAIRKQLKRTSIILDLTSMNSLDPSIALVLSQISREAGNYGFIMIASKEVEIFLKKVDIKCGSSINDSLREIRCD
ncbi:DgyrCDS5005 [Dimorphilus gyrociliatus]|uniref:DgyrCDS5005 n=1 Tax=Dimorphilus gyrociliatus TaxID=2664684 RepID=A0A7I8VK36_9ANNE|nr:DgyrCDS5005 [Dimorphilus gyrociliatus]